MTTDPTVDDAADPTAKERRELDEQRVLTAAALPTEELRAADLPEALLFELLEASWLGTLTYTQKVTVPADRIIRDDNRPEGGSFLTQ